MRGKEEITSIQNPFVRITPAHAGKSLKEMSIKPLRMDHPRTCGEKFINFNIIATGFGSPPHMRGKEASLSACESFARITPAHAGKRSRKR